MKKHFLLGLLFVSYCFFTRAQTETDFTDITGGKVTAQYNDAPDGEGAIKLIDNSSETKTLTFHSNAWIQFQSPKPYCISRYTMTSGDDAEERDPLNWELSGSNNGVTFYPIDKRENEDFSSRGLKRSFTISNNNTSYLYYRLTMTNNMGPILQMSELELFGIEGQPFKDVFADFTLDSYLVTGDLISFTNASMNTTTSKWIFKGGNPSTSTEVNPKVVFNKPGTYKVKLIASNGKKKTVKMMSITVKDVNDWSTFVFPVIKLDCSNTANAGYLKYQSMVYKKGFKSIEDFVQNCCLVIAKKLYRTVDEANEHNVKSVNYLLREGGYISYENNMFPAIEIGFDMDYLNKFAQTHPDSVAADEVYGILCHELCHGYQNWPKNAGEYGKPNECFGFVEGTADLARLLTGGFNPKRYPRVGGTFLDGYNTTGFFYLWINETKDANFLQKINKSAKTMDTWSLEALTQELFGASAKSLWDEYQLAIPAIVEKSKKADNISSK